MTKPVLLVGKTWVNQTTHIKGVDSYTTASFGSAYSDIKAAIEGAGHVVDIVESHRVADHFPTNADDLARYGTIILSDIGANSFLLTPTIWRQAKKDIDRLQLIADYVKGGGGLVMSGGYLSFCGIEGKGFWRSTPVADALPVTISEHDDRVEYPEGIAAESMAAGHEILKGVDGEWPLLLGYNRVGARPEAKTVATIGGDPLLVLGEFGRGRTVAFTSDCSPHWCPRPFLDWAGYAALWGNICRWSQSSGTSSL